MFDNFFSLTHTLSMLNNNIKNKFMEAVFSIAPIFVFVIVLSLTIAPLNANMTWKFVFCSLVLIVGMFLFTVGADSSMVPIGENIGGALSKSRRLKIFVLCSFVLGFVITIVEPDLEVLASQILDMDKGLFIAFVALGGAVFVTIAILRIIFQVKMQIVLFISYAIVVLLMFFVPSSFLPIVFDAGGVTTGPISTPFLLAFCFGVSAVRSSKTSMEDSFGLLALASVGPIIFVELISIFIGNATPITETVIPVATMQSFAEFIVQFFGVLFNYIKEVGIIVATIAVIFGIFNSLMLKLPKTKIRKILVGILFTYLGIVIFLTGATVGYLPVANLIGYEIASSTFQPWLFPIVLLFGFCVVAAEPAIHVLVKKVFEITNGTISKRVIFISIAISVSLAMVLGVVKILFSINFLYIILPCYVLAMALMFVCPKIFTVIAFDAGGVASGSMSSCFLLPFILGIQPATLSLPENAFGTIALIAAAPLIVIQLLGVYYRILNHFKEKNNTLNNQIKPSTIEIIEFGE